MIMGVLLRYVARLRDEGLVGIVVGSWGGLWVVFYRIASTWKKAHSCLFVHVARLLGTPEPTKKELHEALPVL